MFCTTGRRLPVLKQAGCKSVPLGRDKAQAIAAARTINGQLKRGRKEIISEDAVERAGIATADRRLRSIGLAALESGDRSMKGLEDDAEAALALFSADEIMRKWGRFLDELARETGKGTSQGKGTREGQALATRALPDETRSDGGQTTRTDGRSSSTAAGPRHLPGHAKPRSAAAVQALAATAARAVFDTTLIRGRAIGDILYGEMERSAMISLNDGLENLRQAALQSWLFGSVPYNPALRDVPARAWAPEEEFAKFDARWRELMDHVPKLTTAQIAEIFRLERTAA